MRILPQTYQVFLVVFDFLKSYLRRCKLRHLLLGLSDSLSVISHIFYQWRCHGWCPIVWHRPKLGSYRIFENCRTTGDAISLDGSPMPYNKSMRFWLRIDSQSGVTRTGPGVWAVRVEYLASHTRRLWLFHWPHGNVFLLGFTLPPLEWSFILNDQLRDFGHKRFSFISRKAGFLEHHAASGIFKLPVKFFQNRMLLKATYFKFLSGIEIVLDLGKCLHKVASAFNTIFIIKLSSLSVLAAFGLLTPRTLH